MNIRLIALVITLLTCNVFAAPVTSWHTFRAAPATTLTGQGTSSPVVGSASAQATSSVLAGYFDALSLTNLGDRITFSYQVSFTDAAGMANGGDNFRFALFDLNGQTPVPNDNYDTAGVNGSTDNWRGYWFGVRNGTGTGSGGSIRERISELLSGDNPFAATGANLPSAPSIGSVGGASTTLQSSTEPTGGPVYTGIMVVEKTPSGVALAGLFGGNGGTNLMAVDDNTSPFPASYAAVGYLIGSLNIDQVNFQNVTVTYSPSNALHITSQPEDVSVLVGLAAQFDVSWAGSGLNASLQWRENGIDIPGATNSSYTVGPVTGGQDSNTYSVVIQNIFGETVTSSNATLDVVLESVPPTVLSASSLVSNVIDVVFSEAVDPVTAVDGSSYLLSGNSIAERTMVSSNIVSLTLDNAITTNYVLTVQNVQDYSGNPIAATNVPGATLGWQGRADVHPSNADVGYAFAADDKIKVHATGNDIFNTQDQFEFVYKTYSGDFDVMVRVESLLDTDPNAKAGLMARANTAPDIFSSSRNVALVATPARFIFQYRGTNEASGSTSVSNPRPPTDFPNCWVRLKRAGSVISGYTSTNLNQWTFVSSYDTTVSLDGAFPLEILVGLAVTSHNLSEQTEAVFSDFGDFIERPLLSISRVGNSVELQWASTGFFLQTASSLTPPIEWSDISGSDSTNQVSVPLGEGPIFFRLQK